VALAIAEAGSAADFVMEANLHASLGGRRLDVLRYVGPRREIRQIAPKVKPTTALRPRPHNVGYLPGLVDMNLERGARGVLDPMRTHRSLASFP